MQGFAGFQYAIHHRSPGMHKGLTVPVQALHHESLTAKKTGQYLALKVNADGNSPCGAKKAVFLANKRTTDIG